MSGTECLEGVRLVVVVGKEEWIWADAGLNCGACIWLCWDLIKHSDWRVT